VDYWLSFLTGFFGSMHCVGMCGPIVLGYSTQGLQQPSALLSSLPSHLTYNGGRVLSYTLVGGFLGAVGGGIAALHGVAFWFSLVSGALLIVFGISILNVVPWLRLPAELSFESPSRSILFRAYRATFGSLITRKSLESKLYIGLLTALLPCGLLYSMFLKAASSGGAITGALTMFWFGLGIVPALVVTGLASSIFGMKMRKWGNAVAAVIVVVMGMMLILRAFGVPLFGSGMHQH
jgi:sulfite exporter TauE/SafE